MQAVMAGKTLKEYFSRASVERLSASCGDPDWLRDRRMAAWEYYERHASDEGLTGTRFLTRLKEAHRLVLEPGAKGPIPEAFRPSLQSEWGPLAGCASYGCELSEKPWLSPEWANQGVLFLPLREALRSHEDLVKKHLFSRGGTDETVYTALHAAYLGQGSFLYVPKGLKLHQPLRNIGTHTGGHAGFFPHTLAVLEEGAEATVIDELHSASDSPGFCSLVSELVLGRAARLSYIQFQNLNQASGSALRQRTTLASDSYLYTLGMVAGGSFSSSYLESRLDGEGGQVDLLGLVLAGGAQEVEIRTLQDHQAKAGMSDALVKSILRGRAHFYFDGVVKIHKEGQNSNAFQSNPNLLLSPDCKAESIPTLEIEADDVACKHAASIGSIDEEERFYLLSRGVNPRETEELIVEGFAAELAQRLPDENLQERFVEILNRLTKQHAA
jgi:Fe-S cluster assembly protein SufD